MTAGPHATEDASALVRPRRIVLFTGGTACRNINIALSRMSAKLTRIVPAWDSGGSSKVLRDAFQMLPVGDVRQALMTMAHGEGRAGGVVKICNSRISDALGRAEARFEFEYYARGDHPLLRSMDATLRDAILAYLKLFKANLPADFDFRNGSIGNFILTGACFAHAGDINAAILTFRELCGIEGNVWPASVQSDVHLSAHLNNGRVLKRQHLVTKMDDDDSLAGIAEIGISAAGQPVVANVQTLAALREADAVVFGPGSFYTSILPHLLVAGVAEAIARTDVPKIFVGNILECTETRGAELGILVEKFLAADGVLTHVLGNSELFPFEKTVGKFSYLRPGDIAEVSRSHACTYLSDDLEDAWTRGHHDGRAVARRLLAIAGGVVAD